MAKTFWEAVKARRSFYGIGKEKVVEDAVIEELVGDAVKHTPSAFNSQSSRVVLLLGAQHDAVWDITEAELKKVVPAENFAATAERIAGFRSGYGTILYFEDTTVVEGLQAQFPLYKDNFPVWSQHASAMLQYVIWTALEDTGFGVSLQHYNPLIDAEVKARWQVPPSWKLVAQMPFGKPTAVPQEKEYSPLTERMKVYK